jgi:hypothetical protein
MISYQVSNQQQGDYEADVQFAKNLFMEFKQKNKDEGINGAQALWLHNRVRALEVNFPGMPSTIQDIINMGASGDIQTACLCLMFCTPDDMSQPYHWLSAERVNWLISAMKNHLGWT